MTTNQQPRNRAGRFRATAHTLPEMRLTLEATEYVGPGDRQDYRIYGEAANADGPGVFAAFAEASVRFDWTAAMSPMDP